MTRYINAAIFLLFFAALGWFFSWAADNRDAASRTVVVGPGPQPPMADQWQAFATRGTLPSDEAATAWRLRQLAVARAEAELEILRKNPGSFRPKYRERNFSE